MNKDIKKRAKILGITKPVYLYLFRHSVPIELLSNGMELSDVSNLLGHADPKTTMRYKHANLDHFYNELLVHPLMENEITWKKEQERIEKEIRKLVPRKFKLNISLEKKKIYIEILNPEGNE